MFCVRRAIPRGVRSNVRFCFTSSQLDSRKPTSSQDGIKDGFLVHKSTAKPTSYDLELIVNALRACVEPACEKDPIRARFYCRRINPNEKKKLAALTNTLIFPHMFGSKSSVTLLAEDDSPVAKELEGDVDEILYQQQVLSYFTEVQQGLRQMSDVYITTLGMEILARRYGAVLKDKTPARKRGLAAKTAEELKQIAGTVCYTRRYEVTPEGVCDMAVGSLDFNPDHLLDNLRKVLDELKSTCKHTEGKFVNHVVLCHSSVGFCLNLAAL